MLVTKKGQDVNFVGRPQAGKSAGAKRVVHAKIINSFLMVMPDGVYDGELYLPGGHSTDVSALTNFNNLHIVLYDVLEFRGTSLIDRSYIERRSFLEAAFSGWTANYLHIAQVFPPSKPAYDMMVERGAEGVILKRKSSLYYAGERSTDWLKFKKREEGEFVIIGFKTGLQGPHSVILMARLSDGKKVQAKILNKEWIRRCASGNIHEGTIVEVEYQRETSAGFNHPMIKRVKGES
jgi:ATP-dependent DNA ligase